MPKWVEKLPEGCMEVALGSAVLGRGGDEEPLLGSDALRSHQTQFLFMWAPVARGSLSKQEAQKGCHKVSVTHNGLAEV